MASIDKTYIISIEQYKELYDWCNSIGTITDDYGNTITPMDYLYSKNIEEIIETLKVSKEVPVWNTNTIFDIYLIRYCPIQFIQDRMAEVYSKKYIEDIKNRTSEYDTYQRNAGSHFSVLKNKNRKRDKYTIWSIWADYDYMPLYYAELENKWYDYREAHMSDRLYTLAHTYGNLSIRKLSRLVKKWKLPKGAILKVIGEDRTQYIEIKIK